MLVKESGDLTLQLSCVFQLTHGTRMFKKFALDFGGKIVPLHEDCGAEAPQNMLLFENPGTALDRSGHPNPVPRSSAHVPAERIVTDRRTLHAGATGVSSSEGGVSRLADLPAFDVSRTFLQT